MYAVEGIFEGLVRHFGKKSCMYYQEACNILRFFTYVPAKGGQISEKICMYIVRAETL